MWKGKKKRGMLLIALVLPLSCCWNGRVQEDLSKCDAVVQKILRQAEVTDAEVQRRVGERGEVLYHLIVKSSANEIFTNYGISVTSSFPPYYVVWVTEEQLWKLVRSPVVQSVQRGAVHTIEELKNK